MPIDLVITEADILAKVTERSFERGWDYYSSGMVESAVQRGNRLFAKVLGSEWDPYRVGVTLQGDDFSAACTCPYDWGGYCKHIVATLLTWIHDRDLVAVRPPIENLLSNLEPGRLRALIVHMVESNPELADVVDSFCAEDDGVRPERRLSIRAGRTSEVGAETPMLPGGTHQSGTGSICAGSSERSTT